MDEQRAKQIIGARIALDIIRATCDAHSNPRLRHNTDAIVYQDLTAAKVLGIDTQVRATISRVCGLDCQHCTTPHMWDS